MQVCTLCLRESGVDRLGEPLQPVDHGDQDIVDPAVAQFVDDAAAHESGGASHNGGARHGRVLKLNFDGDCDIMAQRFLLAVVRGRWLSSI